MKCEKTLNHMYSKALKYAKTPIMPIEITELSNIGRWKVGSKSLENSLNSFIVKIAKSSSNTFAFGITKP